MSVTGCNWSNHAYWLNWTAHISYLHEFTTHIDVLRSLVFLNFVSAPVRIPLKHYCDQEAKPHKNSSLEQFVYYVWLNTSRPRQNGRHFSDDIFKRIFLKANCLILIKISLKFVLQGPLNNIPALVQTMAWYRSGDKPLSESMMVLFDDAYICVTRPQWVKRDMYVIWYDSYGIVFIVESTWWLLVTWPLFDPKTCAISRWRKPIVS